MSSLNMQLNNSSSREHMLSNRLSDLERTLDMKSVQFNLALNKNKKLRSEKKTLCYQLSEANNSLQCASKRIVELEAKIELNSAFFFKELHEKDSRNKHLVDHIQWQRVMNGVISSAKRITERRYSTALVTIGVTRNVLSQSVNERNELQKKLLENKHELSVVREQAHETVEALQKELECSEMKNYAELHSVREELCTVNKEVESLSTAALILSELKEEMSASTEQKKVLKKKLDFMVEQLSRSNRKCMEQQCEFNGKMALAEKTNSDLTLLINQLNGEITAFRKTMASCMIDPIRILDSKLDVVQNLVPLNFLVTEIEAAGKPSISSTEDKRSKKSKTRKKKNEKQKMPLTPPGSSPQDQKKSGEASETSMRIVIKKCDASPAVWSMFNNVE